MTVRDLNLFFLPSYATTGNQTRASSAAKGPFHDASPTELPRPRHIFRSRQTTSGNYLRTKKIKTSLKKES